VGNAIKFTDSGSVELKAEYRIPGEDQSAGTLLLSVKDTGIGIKQESMQLLFMPFSQLESDISKLHQGTGLGLAISKKLAEMMGGGIQVFSEEKVGSRFIVLVPCSPPAEIMEKAESFRPKSFNFESSLVLVADDIETNRILVEEILKQNGLRVITAKNGLEAVQMVEERKPDLLLLDIRMPEMDGYEALRNIRLMHNADKLPIVALTAHALKQDEEQILSIGFDGYIRKPFTRSELLAELSRFLPIKSGPNLINECDYAPTPPRERDLVAERGSSPKLLNQKGLSPHSGHPFP
jgi:CheY-like chemotaxis protein